MGSFGIGAKLRQERIGQGLSIEDVARETRIKPRFLEAIEADELETLPGLVFTRSFVKQFALTVKLDPDPLVAELPKQDESTFRLPDPPARPRSSYQADRWMNSGVWLLVAVGAVIGASFHFSHSGESAREDSGATKVRVAQTAPAASAVKATTPRQASPVPASTEQYRAAPVQVVITAHQAAWVQVSADGKNTFTGTLQPDESRQISATDQVKLIAGNAGGLTVSLNGKKLDPLGSTGQVRVLRLTAGGPEFLGRDQQPAPAPL